MENTGISLRQNRFFRLTFERRQVKCAKRTVSPSPIETFYGISRVTADVGSKGTRATRLVTLKTIPHRLSWTLIE
jgi:hypothetical protein